MTKLKLGPIFACKTSLVANFYGVRAKEETLMSVMILYEYELMFIAHV